jgi:hypothetical protein
MKINPKPRNVCSVGKNASQSEDSILEFAAAKSLKVIQFDGGVMRGGEVHASSTESKVERGSLEARGVVSPDEPNSDESAGVKKFDFAEVKIRTSDTGYGAVFSSHVSGSSAYGAAFGAAYARDNGASVSDWTVEFSASITASATGCAPKANDIHLGTLGGDRSDSVRFYFNDAGVEVYPSVVIAALKLESAWTISQADYDLDTNSAPQFAQQSNPRQFDPAPQADTDSGPGSDFDFGQQSASDSPIMIASAVVCEDQGYGSDTYARAVALGPNFQLNVGRTRKVFGGVEIEGGIGCEGAGTMHLLGAISAAGGVTAGVQPGSTMRIDGGWEVNAYRPICDLATIEILNGSLNLMEKDDEFTDTDEKFSIAMEQLATNLAYTNDDGKIYQNDGTMAACEDRSGGVVIHCEKYPIRGKLTVGAGQSLVFSVCSERESSIELPSGKSLNLSMFHRANGTITLPAVANDPRLILRNGGNLRIVNSGDNSLPNNAIFWIVRAPHSSEPSDVLDLGDEYAIDTNPYELSPSPSVKLHKITANGGFSELTSPGFSLYWMEYGTEASGLAMGTRVVTAKPSKDSGGSLS